MTENNMKNKIQNKLITSPALYGVIWPNSRLYNDLTPKITPPVSSNSDEVSCLNKDNNNNDKNNNPTTTPKSKTALFFFPEKKNEPENEPETEQPPGTYCLAEPEKKDDDDKEKRLQRDDVDDEDLSIVNGGRYNDDDQYDEDTIKFAESVESALFSPFEKQAKKAFPKKHQYKPLKFPAQSKLPTSMEEYESPKDFKSVMKFQSFKQKHWKNDEDDVSTHFAKENFSTQGESNVDFGAMLRDAEKLKKKKKSKKLKRRPSSSKSLRSHDSPRKSSSKSTEVSLKSPKSASKTSNKSSSKSKINGSASSTTNCKQLRHVSDKTKPLRKETKSDSHYKSKPKSKKTSGSSTSTSTSGLKSKSKSKSKSKAKIVAKPGIKHGVAHKHGAAPYVDGLNNNLAELMALQNNGFVPNMHINLNMNGIGGGHYYDQQYMMNHNHNIQCYNNYNIYNPQFNHPQFGHPQQAQYPQAQYPQVPYQQAPYQQAQYQQFSNGYYNYGDAMHYFPKPYGMPEIAENVNDSNSVPHSQISYSNSREGEDYQVAALI